MTPQAVPLVDKKYELRTGDPRVQALRERDPVGYLEAQLKRRLRHLTGHRVIAEGDAVRVPRLTDSGPDIAALLSEGRCTVAIGPWFEEMPSLELALEYMARAADGSVRIRLDSISGKPWRYVLERLVSGGVWQEDSAVILPRLTFFKREVTTTYLRNEPRN